MRLVDFKLTLYLNTLGQPSGNDHVDAGEEKVKGDEAATGGERTEVSDAVSFKLT